MTQKDPRCIYVLVAPSNPGQFFACCGLLESADRLWGGAEGWFAEGAFFIRPLDVSNTVVPTLSGLIRAVAEAELVQLDSADDLSSPIEIKAPFDLRLDWWVDHHLTGERLKTWAGSMSSIRIARAMQGALRQTEFQNENLLNKGTVVYAPQKPDRKVEPFYFDARRGSNALPRDLGFSPDAFQLTSTAYPAVELLCLVGLQRFRAMPTEGSLRKFDYHTWGNPLDAHLAPCAACGLLVNTGGRGFHFENAFRTDQRKHKAFTPATNFQRS